MSSPYVYDALQENHIRLLSVTADDSATHGIVLDLRQIVLGDAEYTALSYTWGRPEPLSMDPSFDEDKTYELRCGSGFVTVRQNLFDFLQQAKAFDYPLPLLWIDALCINQEDLKEKSKQVLSMTNIYASAQHVWIWLGAREPTKGAQQILDDFIPAILQHDFDFLYQDPYLVIPNRSCEKVIEETVGPDKWSIWPNFWREYVDLLQRCWFTRGWTIQEVVREDISNIMVFFGPRKYPWEKLFGFLKAVRKFGWTNAQYEHRETGHIYGFRNSVTRTLVDSTIRTKSILYEAETPVQQWYAKLLEIIQFLARFEVSDDRDKIFAYLGLLWQSAPPELELSFTPDYSLSIEQTYVKFTEVLVREMYHLDVLSMAGNQNECEHKKTPSWVPDYTRHVDIIQIVRDCRADCTCGIGMPAVDGDRLRLYGTCLTTVGDVVPLNESPEFMIYFLDMCQRPQHDYKTVSSMPKALWYILTESVLDLRRNWETQFRRWLSWKYLVMVRLVDAETERGADICGYMRRTLNDLYPEKFDFDQIQQGYEALRNEKRAYYIMAQRRLYTTTDGYLGAGPDRIQPGDEVWILDKGRVPYLLRRNTNYETYRLVGESVVHGVRVEELLTEDCMPRFKPVVLV